MDKKKAIEEALRQQKEEHEKRFQSRVQELVYEIGQTSQRLRKLKAELTSLEYKEPEIGEDFDG